MSVGPRSATPVMLLLAWGESRRSFDRLMPMLADSVHAVAVDQRGHGEADKPRDGYSLAGWAEDIVAVMDAMGIASAVLLGSSSGGYVAQQVAATNPHHVAGLVLVGSPRSLQGRPPFADEVDRLCDPVDEVWVRASHRSRWKQTGCVVGDSALLTRISADAVLSPQSCDVAGVGAAAATYH